MNLRHPVSTSMSMSSYTAAMPMTAAVVVFCMLLNFLAPRSFSGTGFSETLLQAMESQSVLADVVALTVMPAELVNRLIDSATSTSPSAQKKQKAPEKNDPITSSDYLFIAAEKRSTENKYDAADKQRGGKGNTLREPIVSLHVKPGGAGCPLNSPPWLVSPVFLICFLLLPRSDTSDSAVFDVCFPLSPACRLKAGYFYWRLLVLEGGTNA